MEGAQSHEEDLGGWEGRGRREEVRAGTAIRKGAQIGGLSPARRAARACEEKSLGGADIWVKKPTAAAWCWPTGENVGILKKGVFSRMQRHQRRNIRKMDSFPALNAWKKSAAEKVTYVGTTTHPSMTCCQTWTLCRLTTPRRPSSKYGSPSNATLRALHPCPVSVTPSSCTLPHP